MEEYTCTVCGFIYNEESAEVDASGDKVEFKDLPNEWCCPNCGVSPDLFSQNNSSQD